MKKHYGQFRYPVWAAHPGQSKTDFCRMVRSKEFARNLVLGVATSRRQVDYADMYNMLEVASGEADLMEGKGTHLFVPPDAQRLVTQASRKISDKEMLEYAGEQADLGVVYTSSDKPYMFKRTGNGDFMVSSDDFGMYRVNKDAIDSWLCAWDDAQVQKMRYMLRFTCGLFMLRQCFPEMFKEGVPVDLVKHEAWYRKLVGAVAVRTGRKGGSVCAHLRQGHFRLLKSEKFRHKRGQVIFVKPAMVKGKAQTCVGDKNRKHLNLRGKGRRVTNAT